jgi:hypothetical protein
VEAFPGTEGLTILRRLLAYAEKVFQFSGTVVAGIADRRLQPLIPTALVVKSVAVLFWARMGRLHALELAAHSRFFHRWIGQSVCSADSIGRVNALVDAEGLRQGLHHPLTVLKDDRRNLYQDAAALFAAVPAKAGFYRNRPCLWWDFPDLPTWPQVQAPVRVIRSLETYSVKRQLDGKEELKTSDWVWVTTLPLLTVSTERAVGFGHQ